MRLCIILDPRLCIKESADARIVWCRHPIYSIVCSSGIHGTHVSSIVAANVEDNPDINGVAPGAEIVSLMIGDNRLDSLETHQALMRATKAIMWVLHWFFNVSARL